MAKLREVQVGTEAIEQFASVATEEQMREAREAAHSMRGRFAGRVVWNVSSTSVGGGVAEMLRGMLAYSRGAGIDARWVVIEGDPPFFRITKRLHHALHGSAGDGSPLGANERAHYEAVLLDNARELAGHVRPGDVVLLHDPQTAGIGPWLADSGAQLLFRLHIGTDRPDGQVALGVSFLAPYLEAIPIHVFSREAYLHMGFRSERAVVVPPSIDAFSPKNMDLSPRTAHAIMVHAGLLEGPPPEGTDTVFHRQDGTPGRVECAADLIRLGRPPTPGQPLVVQVSRWDPLKDPLGVMEGFAHAMRAALPHEPHLILAGPNVHGVADDPEAAATLDEVVDAWRELPHGTRRHITLATLPTADVDENAVMVNALQRSATVVLQKSLQEGFGLTVAEALWKKRPVIASAVGGICDQIEHGVSGLLLSDPTDPSEMADALVRLLRDEPLRARLGEAGRERVREQFLALRHLGQYAELLR